MSRLGWICAVAIIGFIAMVGLLTPQRGLDLLEEATAGTEDEAIAMSRPTIWPSEQQALVAGNTKFALDLYMALRRDVRNRNLFFSPYSVSLALGMAYAGAHGTTAGEMAHVLHFPVDSNRLPLVFGAINARLAARGSGTVIDDTVSFELRLANSLWAQEGFAFRQTFLDTLKARFGTPLELVDFEDAPAASRRTINRWVSRQTGREIRELLPEETITLLTRLMLASAAVFSATWEHQFDQDFTCDAPFCLIDGRRVAVSMMEQITPFGYVATDDVQAVELPYVGGQFTMVVLLPTSDRFEAFAGSLTSDRLTTILAQLETQLVHVHMPRFEFGSSFELRSALGSLGMRRPFVLGEADFTGMAGTRELFLGEIHHQTYVSVDEVGTSAAVSSAMGLIGAGAPDIKLDHPFIFLIRDMESGTILFLGEVMDPSRGDS